LTGPGTPITVPAVGVVTPTVGAVVSYAVTALWIPELLRFPDLSKDSTW
jgi:hypothetical protein